MCTINMSASRFCGRSNFAIYMKTRSSESQDGSSRLHFARSCFGNLKIAHPYVTEDQEIAPAPSGLDSCLPRWHIELWQRRVALVLYS